jgi:hypothetical protein
LPSEIATSVGARNRFGVGDVSIEDQFGDEFPLIRPGNQGDYQRVL